MPEAQMDINKETTLIAGRMNELYSLYASRKIKREDADSLANIAGKHLKAVAINLANQMFLGELEKLTRPDVPTPLKSVGDASRS